MTRIADILRLLEPAPAWVVEFTHDAAPVPKARARAVRGAVFTPPKTRAAETALAWRWKLALRGATHEGCLAVGCLFYRPSRLRVDVDNLVKLVMDAGTKARAWTDDSQIVSIVARVELDAANPRTEIVLMPSVSTMRR